MPAPFALLQARVNRVTAKRLANAFAFLPGALDPVPVLFEEPGGAPFDTEVDATSPECWGESPELVALERDDELTIEGRAFKVTRPEPDGFGGVRLVLEEV